MKLKKIIFETSEYNISDKILANILNEKDPNKQLIMAKLNLRQLGSGAGRSVFDLGNQKVLKLRSNSIFSSSQNKTEYKNWQCVQHTKMKDFFVKVFEAAPNYSWLISEKVIPLNKKDKVFIYQTLIKLITDSTNPQLEDLEIGEYFFTIYDIFQAAKEKKWPIKNTVSEWFEALGDALNTCDISYSDFSPENFGLNSENNLVILDYGI